MKAAQTKPSSAEALCLQFASGIGERQHDYYMVRIPVRGNVKVGQSLGIRLGDRAEQFTTGKVWRVFVPLAKLDEDFRNYILCDYGCYGPRYVAALLRALQEFGLLEVAQMFTADADAGVMRRIVSRAGGAR